MKKSRVYTGLLVINTKLVQTLRSKYHIWLHKQLFKDKKKILFRQVTGNRRQVYVMNTEKKKHLVYTNTAQCILFHTNTML